MGKQLRDMSHINVITISQQYGSDGYKLAARLAYKLHWFLVEDAIARQVASQLDMTEEEAIIYDERALSAVDRFLLSMQVSTATGLEVWPSGQIPSGSPRRQERLYREKLRDVIEALASSGQRVIVGHGAQVVLEMYPNVLHVRVVAPLYQRIRYVMQREQLSEEQAYAHIRRKDRQFAHYIRAWYHRDIDDPLLYDLVVNSNTFNIESQADLICRALGDKVR